MARFRVGCVPYVNASPLVWWFVNQGQNSPVEVVFDVPSQLPRLLEGGEVDAILVSSIDALRHSGRKIADGVCIGSHGPVESVRLLSRVPFGLIQTLALDQSSMTSNALARVLLQEGFGARPATLAMPPDLPVMLDVCEACVVIGDNGMAAQYPGARMMDLGQAWTDATGLPFVWAMWTGLSGLTPELTYWLNHSYDQGRPDGPNWSSVLEYAAQKVKWDTTMIDRYLRDCVQFSLGDLEFQGWELYGEKLVSLGLLEEIHWPDVVNPAQPSDVLDR